MAQHSPIIAFADVGTERDCGYVIALMEIENGILARVLADAGVSVTSLSGPVLRGMAVQLYRWR